MPNRIIKDSICTSEDINSLDDQAECFFYRLMTACDDFGIMDARPVILKARCYPLKSIDINRIQEMLGEFVGLRLIRLYSVDGKPFLQFVNWEKHQQIRAKKPKYPLPSAGVEITCNQLISDAPVIQSNPIQSCTAPNAAKPVRQKQIEFDGHQFLHVTEDHRDLWQRAYPALSLDAELSKAAAWLNANPKNRKSNYDRFLTNWLARAQDKAPRMQASEKPRLAL